MINLITTIILYFLYILKKVILKCLPWDKPEKGNKSKQILTWTKAILRDFNT